MILKEIFDVYSDNNMKRINMLCGRNAKLLIVKPGGK
jgi:hypothetical protein